ncbi:MAG: DUF3501 family protein [Acidibacillus sp.]|nr:DUF3501 family protein [Acidibacillus sp.]
MAASISMKDVVSLHTYKLGRDEYVRKMIEYKRRRRVKVSEYMSLLFENRKTVLFQIQELVNAEDLEDADEIKEYIDIYSPMLPGEDEWSATLFIEMDDLTQLEDKLTQLKGIEHALFIEVGTEVIPAIFEEEHTEREFTTSVHYVKFPLTPTAKQYVLHEPASSSHISIVLDHANVHLEIALTEDTIGSLQEDIR